MFIVARESHQRPATHERASKSRFPRELACAHVYNMQHGKTLLENTTDSILYTLFSRYMKNFSEILLLGESRVRSLLQLQLSLSGTCVAEKTTLFSRGIRAELCGLKLQLERWRR